MTLDERLATIESGLASGGRPYDWPVDIHWLLALCRRQREALRAVSQQLNHGAGCPVEMDLHPSDDDPRCDCVVAKVRAALEVEP